MFYLHLTRASNSSSAQSSQGKRVRIPEICQWLRLFRRGLHIRVFFLTTNILILFGFVWLFCYWNILLDYFIAYKEHVFATCQGMFLHEKSFFFWFEWCFDGWSALIFLIKIKIFHDFYQNQWKQRKTIDFLCFSLILT